LIRYSLKRPYHPRDLLLVRILVEMTAWTNERQLIPLSHLIFPRNAPIGRRS
jgi:hypothetical protein